MKHPLSLSELTQRGDPLGDYIDFMSRNLLSAAERSTLDCRLAKIDREKFGDAESFAVAMNAFRIKMRVLSKIEPEKFRSIKVRMDQLFTHSSHRERGEQLSIMRLEHLIARQLDERHHYVPSRQLSRVPKGLILDFCVPPEHAEEAAYHLLGRYEHWVEKHGARKGRAIFAAQSVACAFSFWTDWLLRRLKPFLCRS
jgi:hypothetical protein